jgi:acyl-CoA hydrolase
MPSKRVSDSAIEEYFHKVLPKDLNPSNTLFGGKIMELLDYVTSVVAERHANRTCVTASVDSIQFYNPAIQGDVVFFRAAVNRTWRTSMEIGVQASTKNHIANSNKPLVSAYFIFVAVDEERRPVLIPSIIAETPDQQRRYKEADIRRIRRQNILQQKSSMVKTGLVTAPVDYE